MDLEKKLDSALIDASNEAHEMFNYYPTYFIQMLKEHGPVETAKLLIRKKEFSSGLTRLWENKRLDLSVEAIVLNGPWVELFPEDVLLEAEQKLLDLGYNVTRYKGEEEKNMEWTDDELTAAIDMYFQMLTLENKGQSYNKSDYRNKLQEQLADRRSKKSIEFRMQNISSILQGLGLNWIEGYKPANHVGTNVRQRMIEILDSKKLIEKSVFELAANQDQLDDRVVSIMNIGLSTKPAGVETPERTLSETEKYATDPRVKAWVFQIANGHCEYCGNQAPFMTDKGTLYLELHHVKNLADGGPDTVENAVALCPNCHRACHYSEKREALTENLYEKTERLNRD